MPEPEVKRAHRLAMPVILILTLIYSSGVQGQLIDLIPTFGSISKSENVQLPQYTHNDLAGSFPGLFAILNEASVGFSLGYSVSGRQVSNKDYYKVILHILYFRFPLIKNQYSTNQIYLHLEPQFNSVHIGSQRYSEGGFNVGFALHHQISELDKLTLSFGIGPHNITYESNFQSAGFIFSDNLSLGYSRRFKWLDLPFEINAAMRFRHISNGGISNPNAGINNTILLIGIGRILN